MKTEKPEKKGFFALIKEAFSKSGGCCGAGETCGGPKDADKSQPKDAPKVLGSDKPAQK